jgi:hypothetical protein
MSLSRQNDRIGLEKADQGCRIEAVPMRALADQVAQVDCGAGRVIEHCADQSGIDQQVHARDVAAVRRRIERRMSRRTGDFPAVVRNGTAAARSGPLTEPAAEHPVSKEFR